MGLFDKPKVTVRKGMVAAPSDPKQKAEAAAKNLGSGAAGQAASAIIEYQKKQKAQLDEINNI